MYSPLIYMFNTEGMDAEAFTMSRRKGFGASDSSKLLGVNHWDGVDVLIEEKNSPVITAKEIEVGLKPQVRMGNDLEPLIISKASDFLGLEVTKDTNTYYLKDYPQLTINYDGLTDGFVPVECKCVSPFGRKYWSFENSQPGPTAPAVAQNYSSYRGLAEKIATQAAMVGIPEYYYTQVQQQLLGTPSDYAWLAALDVKEWTLHMFKVLEDEDIQRAIIDASLRTLSKCPGIQERIEAMI